MSVGIASGWHDGELKVHERLHVLEERDNPNAPGTALRYFDGFLRRAPLFALGTLDAQRRPWTTLWGGVPGLSQALGNDILAFRTPVDARYDPVVQALFDNEVEDGKVRQAGNKNVMVSGLAMDLENRKRIKLFGRMVVAAIGKDAEEAGNAGEHEADATGRSDMSIQLVLKMEQFLGNCPKYINIKKLDSVKPHAELASEGPILSAEALKLISQADMFFISSSNGDADMDTNHRGGAPGFVRVRLSSDASELIWPEYSGNRLYQTLGNLMVTPLAGLAFPDCETGNVLYVTGTTTVLIGAEASALLAHSNLAVKLSVTDSRFVRHGLPFRTASIGEFSPYNPRVRLLASEKLTGPKVGGDSRQTATLLSQTALTPTISRFKFSLTIPGGQPITWKAGQYIALDFSNELDLGYSHMRDDDPLSINDDFVRTFTISSAPLDESQGSTFELTLRRIQGGPVTEFLFRQGKDANRATSANLEVPVQGMTGTFYFDVAKALKPNSKDTKLVYVASGVGITPLLAQLPQLIKNNLLDRLTVYWTLHIDDLGFVLAVLETNQTLAPRLKLFVTGISDDHGDTQDLDETSRGSSSESLQKLHKADVETKHGRLKEEDLAQENLGQADQIHTCASPKLMSLIREWMQKLNCDVVSEDFAY